MAWNKNNVRNPVMRKELDDIFTGESVVSAIDITSLKIGGVAVTKTASEINALSNSDVLSTKTPVNAVAASGTLTLSGVVLDGETVTIDTDVYEFAADAAQTVTSGNIAVDITSHVTASQGTLTVDTNPTAGDTMTIGTKEYTFVPIGTANADGEIDVEVLLADTQVNIVAAVNGTDGFNVAHTLVSIGDFSSDDAVITALVGGVAGDSIATTETFTAVSNVFDAGTLGTTQAGADCTAANAITAIVAADAGADYTLADGAGDTLTVTCDTKGIVGNAYVTEETMGNAAFGAATLEGGVDGTLGSEGEIFFDTSYIYICSADNTINDNNWRRVSIGNVY